MVMSAEALFEQVAAEQAGDLIHRGFIARDGQHPLILFSKASNTAIAALFFRQQPLLSGHPKAAGHPPARTFLWPRATGAAQFQGVSDTDGIEYELVIANLQHDGFINFNLMPTADAVIEVDPGGMNQVNELAPGQAYAVQSDQTRGHHALKLESISADLTVAKAEAAADNDPAKAEGTYLWLSVVPDRACKKLCTLFEDAEWRATNTYTATTPRIEPRGYHPGGPIAFAPSWGPTPPFAAAAMFVQRAGRRGGRGGRGRGGRGGARGVDTPQFGRGARGPTFGGDYGGGGFGGGGGGGYGDPPTAAALSFSPAAAAAVASAGLVQKRAPTTQSIGVSRGAADGERKRARASEEHLTGALAARTTVSDRVVPVSSYDSGKDYAFEKHSPVCVVAFAVEPKIQFVHDPREAYVAAAKDAVAECVKGSVSVPKVFESEECVLCTEANPDTVLAMCGHQCVHAECDPDRRLQTCPLCRAVIAARLKA
eukprot:m.64465 g.64465  ORF g.64465 m.64465 type:complete len:484 (+) comp9721_c0_seq2:107-1558(+)